MLLCNDASLRGEQRIGDPTELALLDFGAKYGLQRERLEQQYPRFNEIPFDSERKMMTTCHRLPGADPGEGLPIPKGLRM